MFNFLKEYVVADRSVRSKQKPIFYPIYQGEIDEAESLLQMELPKELKRFYQEIGCGFFKSDTRTFFNRFMDPISVADFRLRQDIYEYNPNLDDDSLVFFEVTELNFLTIKFKEENELGQCPTYSEDEKIADSLEEFLIKMDENPDYYI
ncbi:1,3-beta-glucan synthase regulator [Bacillus thuringiensis]|uniref:SMI1/KNR4 family protein n=1 Tax=Bacillus TaxID=1386 RepID=UPI000A39EB97|nr:MULTISPECIES: SMI1/KNR4 family protein [Bacillus]MED3068467.1 SMI1/KNR4 family protein [Bacillus thuringiensis]OUB29448.1 1,3-beta-glucan synthase regulator [Bacillus thuringiensis serovar palmanyolensis]OUB78282.1 1,3-beta-glucan synthase regulator [Bacillus thuringiensis serovar zhaodongensis]PEF29388.1 1,3-beta-glucan synthase regulator [Bacillus thuringiensis]PET84369.1 1,3-beta-glucan synthase regulator [Bacillus thuringiensis]